MEEKRIEKETSPAFHQTSNKERKATIIEEKRKEKETNSSI